MRSGIVISTLSTQVCGTALATVLCAIELGVSCPGITPIIEAGSIALSELNSR